MDDLEYQKEKLKKTQMCSAHPKEEIKAFCKVDFTAVCFRCFLENHKNHEVVMLDDINCNDLKEKISEFEVELTNQSQKIGVLMDKVSESKGNYEGQYKSLRATFDELAAMCQSGELAKEIFGDFEERKKEVFGMHTQIVSLKNSIEIVERDIKELKDDPSDLSVYEGIKQRINTNSADLKCIEKMLQAKNLKLTNLENINLKSIIIDTIRSVLFKKDCIMTSKLVHYYEWGSKNVVFYDIDRKTTIKYSLNIEFNIPKFCRTVATDDGKIFVIGGRDRSNVCCDWMLEYKDDIKSLIHRKPMFLKRSDFTPVYSKSGYVYVVGGNDAKIFYKQCEKYDIDRDCWIKIASLVVGRDSSACCIFEDKLIYAFSGRTKFDKKEITNTIERYTISQDHWDQVTLVNSSWTPCDLGMSYQLDKSSILIFGGFDKDLRTHETFIFKDNEITRGPYLPKEGSFSNFIFHFGSNLYVIGWNNGGKNMYQYSIPERIWRIDDNLIL
jgi:hypothetical protein